MGILILIVLIVCGQSIGQMCTQSLGSVFPLEFPKYQAENGICPAHAHCLQNNYCSCDSGYIGGCTQAAHEMNDGTTIATTADHHNYTFFAITQPVETYVVLIFTLCHTEASSIEESIDVWEDRGNLDVLEKGNALPGGKNWAITAGCTKLSTPLMVFGNQQNGQSQVFILGIKLASEGVISLSLQLEVDVFNFWDLFQKFLMILGGIFLFIFLLTLGVFIVKWRRGRGLRMGRPAEEKDISHFENFMPKYKLNQENRYRTHEEHCSVCLLELGDNEWMRKTVCNHIFHQECLDEWCKSNLNCPICRRSFELRDFQSDLSTNLSVSRNEMRNPLID